MRISVNELEILARKAALGAGIHFGYASEAAQSLIWLAAAGIDAVQGYVHVLQAWSSGKTSPVSAMHTEGACAIKPEKANRACVLYAAPAARDFLQVMTKRGCHGHIELRNVDSSAFVLAELAKEGITRSTSIRCTEPGRASIRWTAWLLVECAHYAIYFDGDLRRSSPADMLVTSGTPPHSTRPKNILTADFQHLCQHGIDIDPSHHDSLRTFLNLTLVPDSEESRKHGAGAGLVDSD